MANAKNLSLTINLLIYTLAPSFLLLFTRGGIAEHVVRTSHTGFYIGLVIWLLAFFLIMFYCFLPDNSIINLKKNGQVVKAKITGDSHHQYSSLPALQAEERVAKPENWRQLNLRFNNLNGTEVAYKLTLPVAISSDLSIEQKIKQQNIRLQIESAPESQLPLWLNTKLGLPALAFAYEDGRVTKRHVIFGLWLLVITLLQMTLPLVHVAFTTRHLTEDMFTLFNTSNVWHWASLINSALLWFAFSHNSTDSGPNGGAIDLIKTAGLKSQTESLCWKQTHFSDDLPSYRVDVSYRDSEGQLQTLSFNQKLSKDKEQKLPTMPQQRPILYMPHDKDKIIFTDREDGHFL